jgi:hypothetical protein
VFSTYLGTSRAELVCALTPSLECEKSRNKRTVHPPHEMHLIDNSKGEATSGRHFFRCSHRPDPDNPPLENLCSVGYRKRRPVAEAIAYAIDGPLKHFTINFRLPYGSVTSLAEILGRFIGSHSSSKYVIYMWVLGDHFKRAVPPGFSRVPRKGIGG